MHCRTCGKEVPKGAIVCMGCGCRPVVGDKFCRECGAETSPTSTACMDCGVALGIGSRASRFGILSETNVMRPEAQANKAPLSPLAIGMAILLFFPLGLYLLWKHPVLARNKAWWWAGGIWSLLVFVAAMNGDKDKKPATAETAPASPSTAQGVIERSRSSRPTATSEVARPEDEPTAHRATAQSGNRASTGRHHGGFRTSSWDYKNGCQVIYDGSVTKPEAKRLGDYLEVQGLFEGDEKTFKIGKAGKTYEFRVIIKKGLEQDPETIEGMRQMGSEISRAVFGDAEVDVHLCDEGFRTIRVVVP